MQAVQIKGPKRASDWYLRQSLGLFIIILVSTINGLKLLVYIVVNQPYSDV